MTIKRAKGVKGVKVNLRIVLAFVLVIGALAHGAKAFILIPFRNGWSGKRGRYFYHWSYQ